MGLIVLMQILSISTLEYEKQCKTEFFIASIRKTVYLYVWLCQNIEILGLRVFKQIPSILRLENEKP